MNVCGIGALDGKEYLHLKVNSENIKFHGTKLIFWVSVLNSLRDAFDAYYRYFTTTSWGYGVQYLKAFLY